jgi:hypothetical protein
MHYAANAFIVQHQSAEVLESASFTIMELGSGPAGRIIG